MRTIIELLEVLEKKLSTPTFYRGLCSTINILAGEDSISPLEHILLKNYLRDHAPLGKSLNVYWWPMHEIEPRRKWLRKRIRIERRKETWNKFLKSIVSWREEHS